jgi:hypothetical protein
MVCSDHGDVDSEERLNLEKCHRASASILTDRFSQHGELRITQIRTDRGWMSIFRRPMLKVLEREGGGGGATGPE